MNKVILIGGAPTVGKSYLGRKLAEELKLPWISTDTIREMMRKLITDEKRFPHLMHDTRYTAEQYLTTFTPEEIVQHSIKESFDTWQGVQALIETDYVWKSFIVEGVAILPELVHKTFANNKSIKPVFLVTENRERIREVVFKRGLWDDADKYSDSLKDVEVEWAYQYSKWLHGEAKKYGYPVYEVKGLDFSIEDIKGLI
jgi:2-phosphoglycerate kinase